MRGKFSLTQCGSSARQHRCDFAPYTSLDTNAGWCFRAHTPTPPYNAQIFTKEIKYAPIGGTIDIFAETVQALKKTRVYLSEGSVFNLDCGNLETLTCSEMKIYSAPYAVINMQCTLSVCVLTPNNALIIITYITHTRGLGSTCWQTIIYGSEYDSISMNCSGGLEYPWGDDLGACDSVQVYAEDSSNVEMYCTGDASCEEVTIDCPTQNDGTCEIDCGSDP